MRKILTVVGARPQFVKAAVVSRALAEYNGIQEIVLHTGQHFDANMSVVFFEEMALPRPNYNLGIDSLSHGAMTGRMLEGIEEVLLKEKPDTVLVYGDTNSTLAGALAASKLQIPIAHVEAGLRSFNRQMPEEINRILTDRVSDWLFCPTQTAINNLKQEGFNDLHAKVEMVGDVMYDAVKYYTPKALEQSTLLRDLNLTEGEFVLATIHRQENTDLKEKLTAVLEGLKAISSEKQVVWPVHPRTAKLMQTWNIDSGNIKLIDPVGYFDMLALLNGCHLIVTDSGGLQKEAYFFQKFCITVREQTEWVELVDEGCNVLTGADSTKIIAAWEESKSRKLDYSKTLYGNGNAGNQIVRLLNS